MKGLVTSPCSVGLTMTPIVSTGLWDWLPVLILLVWLRKMFCILDRQKCYLSSVFVIWSDIWSVELRVVSILCGKDI